MEEATEEASTPSAQSSQSTIRKLVLNNVFGGEPAVFMLPPNYIPPVSDDANDILLIIKFLSEEFPDLRGLIDKYVSNPERKINGLDTLQLLCDDFNRWCDEKCSQERKIEAKRATNAQIKFIMQFIYNRAVSDPDKLNQYEPFSPQVYGETSFDLIEQMLTRVNYLNENDIFVDLGSGVGNVVLHVAAATSCKRCYGFEKAEWPAFYAKRMEHEFKFWMKFFGKTFSDFRLYKADFLAEDEYVEIDECEWSKYAKYEVPSRPHSITMESYVREVINEANLIFVNNYVFGAELDHQLKLRFKDMLEGALIVSSKPFCPLNFRINERNLNDIGTILNVAEFEPLSGHVSWTDKPINYYFHKIDRTLLEKYFESKKNPIARAHKDDSSTQMKHSPKSNSSSHYSSSSSSRYSSSSSRSASSAASSASDSSSNPSSPQSSTDSISSGSRPPALGEDPNEISVTISKSTTSSSHKSRRGRPCKADAVSSSSKKSKKNRRLKTSKKDRKKSSDRRGGVPRRRHSEDASSSNNNNNNKTLVISTSSAKKTSSVMSSSSRKNPTSQQQQHQQQSPSQALLNKSERQTLERMHTATVTSTSGNIGCNSPTRTSTTTATTTNGDAECFNNRSMTKLAAENLDNKRLHESRISSKIFKPVVTNGGVSAVNGTGSPTTSVPPTTASNGINGGGVEASNIDFSNEDVDWDESAIRNLIGEDSMNDIDRYFDNCRKQFIRYLLYVKSGNYKNKLLARLNNGHAVKKELSAKTEESCAKYNNLANSNINLIKSKVAQMGLKDLKAPIELLEYAKTVVSERKMVEEKLSALKPASKAPSCKNETAYSDLKRLIRIFDPSSSSSSENSSSAKRVKLEDNNDESDRVGGGKRANGSASPSSTLKDLQKSQQEQLRGFKIPKSSNGNGNTTSSSSSSLSSNNGASKTSSSSSSSKNQGSNSSNSYYHPKKNHYMMYMMENKACTTQQTSAKNAESPSTNLAQRTNPPISIESIP